MSNQASIIRAQLTSTLFSVTHCPHAPVKCMHVSTALDRPFIAQFDYVDFPYHSRTALGKSETRKVTPVEGEQK